MLLLGAVVAEGLAVAQFVRWFCFEQLRAASAEAACVIQSMRSSGAAAARALLINRR